MGEAITFRNKVFDLCKFLLGCDLAKSVGAVIHGISAGHRNADGSMNEDWHGDYAQIAQHNGNQFHSYLFIDENLDTLNLPSIFSVKHLSKVERLLIERGHNTLLRLVDLCLKDIGNESEYVAQMLNPYFLFKEVQRDQSATSLLTDEQLLASVNAFKAGSAYTALFKSKFFDFFRSIDKRTVIGLLSAIDKEIRESLSGDISTDLEQFSRKLYSSIDNVSDALYSVALIMYAVRASLGIACQMLFIAICGGNLKVLNNENIISIKSHSNVVFKQYEILSQGIQLGVMGSDIGSILLIDCDYYNKIHLHEFGMVTVTTISFSGEMGETTKFSVATVNEELINIHSITDRIIDIGLPVMNGKKKTY